MSAEDDASSLQVEILYNNTAIRVDAETSSTASNQAFFLSADSPLLGRIEDLEPDKVHVRVRRPKSILSNRQITLKIEPQLNGVYYKGRNLDAERMQKVLELRPIAIIDPADVDGDDESDDDELRQAPQYEKTADEVLVLRVYKILDEVLTRSSTMEGHFNGNTSKLDFGRDDNSTSSRADTTFLESLKEDFGHPWRTYTYHLSSTLPLADAPSKSVIPPPLPRALGPSWTAINPAGSQTAPQQTVKPITHTDSALKVDTLGPPPVESPLIKAVSITAIPLPDKSENINIVRSTPNIPISMPDSPQNPDTTKAKSTSPDLGPNPADEVPLPPLYTFEMGATFELEDASQDLQSSRALMSTDLPRSALSEEPVNPILPVPEILITSASTPNDTDLPDHEQLGDHVEDFGLGPDNDFPALDADVIATLDLLAQNIAEDVRFLANLDNPAEAFPTLPAPLEEDVPDSYMDPSPTGDIPHVAPSSDPPLGEAVVAEMDVDPITSPINSGPAPLRRPQVDQHGNDTSNFTFLSEMPFYPNPNSFDPTSDPINHYSEEEEDIPRRQIPRPMDPIWSSPQPGPPNTEGRKRHRSATQSHHHPIPYTRLLERDSEPIPNPRPPPIPPHPNPRETKKRYRQNEIVPMWTVPHRRSRTEIKSEGAESAMPPPNQEYIRSSSPLELRDKAKEKKRRMDEYGLRRDHRGRPLPEKSKDKKDKEHRNTKELRVPSTHDKSAREDRERRDRKERKREERERRYQKEKRREISASGRTSQSCGSRSRSITTSTTEIIDLTGDSD